MLEFKSYMIVFNPYPDMGHGDGFESIMVIKGYSADEALATFVSETIGKGYVPLKVAVLVGEYDMSALKPVSVRTITTERYTV